MDIFKMAIVLVYPDGYVDSLPIKKDVDDHVKYFYEYLQASPRFQKLVKDNGFRFDWIHEYNTTPIIKLLIDNEVIVFINTAIAYVNMSPERANEISYFSIAFPENYDSHVGIPFVKETIKKFDINQFSLDKYSPEMNNFNNFAPDEASIFLEEKNEEEKNIGLV